MFDSLLNLITESSINFSNNLSAWNHNIFYLLILIDFVLIILIAYFNPEKIERLPITLFGLLFSAFVGLCLFAWLPSIWSMGWDTVQYLASKAADGHITVNPADFLNQALSIVGHLFSSAASNAGWNPLQFMGNTLISVVIAFGVFFLFAIIILEIIVNYIMWSVLGAFGGIFVVMYALKATRPSFLMYVKYMFGLLFKSFGLFIMISMLSVYLNTYSDYDKNLGVPPAIPNCTVVKEVQEQILSCSTIKCKADLAPSLSTAQKLCSKEEHALNAWKIKASHGFIERGLILLLVLFIFVMLVKTIPSVFSSLVGTGNYSIKGMSQAISAVAMGGLAAKIVTNSNPAQAIGMVAGKVGGATLGNIASGASWVAEKGANNESEKFHGSVGRVLGKGAQAAGRGAKSATNYGIDKVKDATSWAGGSKDPVKQKEYRRKMVEETIKQFKRHS